MNKQMQGNFERNSEVGTGNGSSESNKSGMESVEDKTRHVLADGQKEVRLTYSDSRPATPRILPKIPLNRNLDLGEDVPVTNQFLVGAGGSVTREVEPDVETTEKLEEDHNVNVVGGMIEDQFKVMDGENDVNLPLSTSFTGDDDVRKRVIVRLSEVSASEHVRFVWIETALTWYHLTYHHPSICVLPPI